MREENAQLKAWMEAMERTDAWKKTFPDPKAFADAIVEYASLDYFVHHSSSLTEPRPWCHGEALAPPTAVVDLPAALENLEPQGALNAPPPSPPPTPLRDLPGASKPINQSTERTFEEMATERGLPGGHDRGNKDAYIPGTPEWYEWLKGRRRLHQVIKPTFPICDTPCHPVFSYMSAAPFFFTASRLQSGPSDRRRRHAPARV